MDVHGLPLVGPGIDYTKVLLLYNLIVSGPNSSRFLLDNVTNNSVIDD